MTTEFENYAETAIRWALNQLGSTEYPGLCLKFVEDAYELGNNIVIDGYSWAREAADKYGFQNDVPPPPGTFVFYDCWCEIEGEFKNWGHVGLSLGDGRVIHGWLNVQIDDYLTGIPALSVPPGWTQPAYLGWTSVPRIMVGVKVNG